MIHQGYIEPQNAVAQLERRRHADDLGQHPGAVGRPQRPGARVRHARLQDHLDGRRNRRRLRRQARHVPRAAGRVLSRKTGKPVKMTMTRDEVFNATGPTSGTYIRVKVGAKKDGTLTAGEAWMAFEAGAFPGSPLDGAHERHLRAVPHPERAHRRLRRRRQQAARRPPTAHPARRPAVRRRDRRQRAGRAAWAWTRSTSASRTPRRKATRRPDGPTKWRQIGNVEPSWRPCFNSPHWKSELQGDHVGRGIAHGLLGQRRHRVERPAPASTPTAPCSWCSGSVDIGGTRASLAMQLAETLGIGADDVKPARRRHRHRRLHRRQTGGSRTTFAAAGPPTRSARTFASR